jgi:hypothetical protein
MSDDEIRATKPWFVTEKEMNRADSAHVGSWDPFNMSPKKVHSVYEARMEVADDIDTEEARLKVEKDIIMVIKNQMGRVNWLSKVEVRLISHLCNASADVWEAVFERELYSGECHANMPALRDAVVASLSYNVSDNRIMGSFVLQAYKQLSERVSSLQQQCPIKWLAEATEYTPGIESKVLMALGYQLELDGPSFWLASFHRCVGHYWVFQMGTRGDRIQHFNRAGMLQAPPSERATVAQLVDFTKGLATVKDCQDEDSEGQKKRGLPFAYYTAYELISSENDCGVYYNALPKIAEFVLPVLLDDPCNLRQLVQATYVRLLYKTVLER